MILNQVKQFRIRSFVRRDGRKTPAQMHAFTMLWPRFGLTINNGEINYCEIFGRKAPCFLEIGFGSGQSLLALAKAHPDKDFIGIETHKPGVCALLLGIQLTNLTNVRVYNWDAIDVLEQCIPNHSLDGVQIFFPDPWPKRRHHARRLIKNEFVQLMIEKLKIDATLHLSTDWEDYAQQMLSVLSKEKNLINLAGLNEFANRSPLRPIITKFERRAICADRTIFDLQFKRIISNSN